MFNKHETFYRTAQKEAVWKQIWTEDIHQTTEENMLGGDKWDQATEMKLT